MTSPTTPQRPLSPRRSPESADADSFRVVLAITVIFSGVALFWFGLMIWDAFRFSGSY